MRSNRFFSNSHFYSKTENYHFQKNLKVNNIFCFNPTNNSELPVMSLVFIALLVGAQVINAHDKMNNSPENNSHKDTNKISKADTCTDHSIQSFNHPNITLGADNGEVIPLSCIEGTPPM